jgi:hypothetical protein
MRAAARAVDEKTARLRALRLAKETAEVNEAAAEKRPVVKKVASPRRRKRRKLFKHVRLGTDCVESAHFKRAYLDSDYNTVVASAAARARAAMAISPKAILRAFFSASNQFRDEIIPRRKRATMNHLTNASGLIL